MTESLHIMPKTTERNLILRNGKSEAEVTNNKTVLEVLYRWSWLETSTVQRITSLWQQSFLYWI